MKTPKKPSYAKGGSLKPVQPGQSGLSKLPTEVRNKMGYMMGGGKLGMMYKNGGKTPIVPDPKKKQVSPMAAKLERAQAMKSEQTFNRNARASEARNLTEMRNAIKAEGPAELAKFDKDLKARGYKVVQKPVKKMAQGGVMKNTKDNNSFISNAVDMSPSTKKQMEALRQAMMYFTGVSPKNK
jgi:hypothetical protein